MSELKFCQGPKCHTHKTQDRIRGPKGNKTFQTRRRSHMYYGGNFCSMNCYNEWADVFIDRAINHFGRITEAKHLTEHNAWYKDYDYDWRATANQQSNWRFVNSITKEIRPLTEAQFDDSNYTLNTGE